VLTASPGTIFPCLFFRTRLPGLDLAVSSVIGPLHKSDGTSRLLLNKATRNVRHLKSSARISTSANLNYEINLTRTLDSKICIRRTILLSMPDDAKRCPEIECPVCVIDLTAASRFTSAIAEEAFASTRALKLWYANLFAREFTDNPTASAQG